MITGVVISLIPVWFGRIIEIEPAHSQNDVLQLLSPEYNRSLYGSLTGYPHMYEFATAQPILFHAALQVPDQTFARRNVSGILMRVNKNGSVTELGRLKASAASWDTVYEWFGGDRYRAGATVDTKLEAGLYRFEVSTPDNIGAYLLMVGVQKKHAVGYFTLVRQLADVKTFLGKSSYGVLVSPVVLGPVVVLCVLCGGSVWFLRRRRAVHVEEGTKIS